MSLTSSYQDTEYGWIGIPELISEPTSNDNDKVIPKYALFDIKRLTRANSFLVMDEIFYISKKDCEGKAKSIFFVYRVSDKRLVTASPMSKEDTIDMVKRKYYEYAE